MQEKIEYERLEELLEKERKLEALENSGVDNWEFYDEAMEELKEYERDKEKAENAIEFIEDIIVSNIDSPAGIGCGYSLTQKGRIEIKKYLLSIL